MRPMSISVLSAVVVLAWCSASLTECCPFEGHFSGSLQLRGLGVFFSWVCMFWVGMVLLCPLLICFVFGGQLKLSLGLFLLNSFLDLWFRGG